VHRGEYVVWLIPYAEALQRVVTDDGSVLLNMKEKVIAGENHSYVYDWVLTLCRALGWRMNRAGTRRTITEVHGPTVWVKHGFTLGDLKPGGQIGSPLWSDDASAINTGYIRRRNNEINQGNYTFAARLSAVAG